MLLYCSLIEYSDSLLLIFKSKRNISGPIIFRAYLECYVDFINLANDRKYGYFMQASFHKDWIKILEEQSKGANPYLSAIPTTTLDSKHMLENSRIELKSLKEKGYSPLSIFKKFHRANVVDEYKSIYATLCAFSHNNISALRNRFFFLQPEKETFDIALFKETDDVTPFIETGYELLRESSFTIHTILNSGHASAFLSKEPSKE
ncbi:DUF5677 domain-containing protein [Paraglaciecola sp.]|uniref:DUF5677 domain-containing protein n=1 Tax=Paraglaciecola sp. TaxID=1920173 RepID=UPI00326365D9